MCSSQGFSGSVKMQLTVTSAHLRGVVNFSSLALKTYIGFKVECVSENRS
jgi:hypothetical protein